MVNFSRDGLRFLGGWHPQALAFDVVEASLVVAGSVWLLALAATSADIAGSRPGGECPGHLRSLHAAGARLLSLEIAARPIPWPPKVKAVLVGTLAVAASLGLAWLLVKRTRLGKII